jgi:hypothetical protein
MEYLGISRPAFSRLVGNAGRDVLAVGRARASRYVASREIPEVGRSVPVFEILESGSSRQLGTLHAVLPGSSFYFEALSEDADSGPFGDLPYFFEDLRPTGFLGRLVPRQHPDLQLPADIQLWTANHTLSYLTRHGWNLPGNLIVGEGAFRRHLDQAVSGQGVIEEASRDVRYLQLAEDVLSHGAPGSSAAGEQPKFLVTRAPGPTPVLVKFSPPVTDALSQRVSDLLIAEFHALETMRQHGMMAARGELVQAGHRTFLEIARFDRLPSGGRRGLMSLRALDLQFVGRSGSWTETTAHLAADRLVEESLLAEVRRRHLFGRLIANTDMHGGNLSFITQGTRIVELAPSYDMAPAMYAPSYGQLRSSLFEVASPDPTDAPHWLDVCHAALDFWGRVASDGRVSESFRQVAHENAAKVERATAFQRLLPTRSAAPKGS